MSGLKKIAYPVAVGVLAITAFIFYDRRLRQAARIGKHNMAGAKKLKVGMDKNAVIKMMGKPYIVEQTDKGNEIYKYTSNNVDYLDIEFYFNREGDVSRIFLPEN